MSKISIITGSTLGNAEYLAEYVEQQLQDKGFITDLHHGPNLELISDNTTWLMISSTHGAGELPDNLKPLFAQIESQQSDLSSLQFSIIGLGSSDYDTFCYAVNHIESALLNRNATLIFPPLKIDVLSEADHNLASKQWLLNFMERLS